MVTVWQLGVIATANYAFLNYLVLVLAIFLLDDRFLRRFVPRRWTLKFSDTRRTKSGRAAAAISAIVLTWIAYATTVPLIQMLWADARIPTKPVALIEGFRIANSYGLFAVMTPHRHEIEFQGSDDGQNWIAYPFRYKPQDVRERPGIYAPYQPRFDWNLWFASLGTWQQYPFVGNAELGFFETNPACWRSSGQTPFRKLRPKWCELSFGSTGSVLRNKNEAREFGGEGNCSGSTHLAYNYENSGIRSGSLQKRESNR